MKVQRDSALDLVKGVCVLAMALHHGINYFPNVYMTIRYVHFVSGAFPFLAGFVVTQISVARYAEIAERRSLGHRLVFRGLRLLLLCGLLNLLLAFVFGGAIKLQYVDLKEYLATLFITGDYLHVSFSLLIPIGYVIAALGVLRYFRLLRPTPVLALTILLFGFCLWTEFHRDLDYYLSYFAIGMVGAAFGFLRRDLLLTACRRLWVVAVLYLTMLIAITLFHQPFWLYTLSIAVTLLFFYGLGMRITTSNWIAGQLLLWGRYSLILYLAQICILFSLRLALRPLGLESNAFLLACALTLLAQTGLCLVFDRLRSAFRVFDTGYRWFFA